MVETSQAQQEPGQMQSLFREGAAQMHAGNTAAAEASFRKAIDIDPSFAPAHLDLGLAQLKEGKLVEAMTSIRKSIELDPASAGAHLFLGIAEYQTNDTEGALRDLHAAVSAAPADVEALTWLGIVELSSGHPELAIEPLDRATVLAPGDENALDYRVQAHMAVARQSYTALYKANPASWRLHRLNAVIDAQANDHVGAIGEYKQAIKLAPNDAELYEGMGWEYRKQGQAGVAAKAFAEQLRLSPGNPIAMYNLAGALVDSGQSQQALPLLQQVVRIYQHPTGADYYLGRALADVGQEKQAVPCLERAATLDGEMQRRALYQLAQTYRHLGKTAEAQQALGKYEQLKTADDQASAKELEDWQKLNAANHAAPSDSGPK